MDKHTKTVLTVTALCVFAMPLGAEEKVWNCEMTGAARTNLDGTERFELEKFKMKVTPGKVAFGTGGYFDGYEKPLRQWFSDYWRVEDKWTVIGFDGGYFNYGSAGSEDTISISARCDDFLAT
tara:strand:+ start:91 stop:459 length:369 start_codon:yes stop_codon:yes gene_type:complete